MPIILKNGENKLISVGTRHSASLQFYSSLASLFIAGFEDVGGIAEEAGEFGAFDGGAAEEL